MKNLKQQLAVRVLDVYADILDVTLVSRASEMFRLEANRIRRQHGLPVKRYPRVPKRKR